MKKCLVLFFLVVSAFMAGAQDKAVKEMNESRNKEVVKDTSIKEGWQKGAIIHLNVAQGSSSNWAAGAEKFSLTINGLVTLYANLYKGKHAWENNLDMVYALTNNTSQGFRKNDDRIDYFTKYTYELNDRWAAGFVGNLRTQFSEGYNYNETPKKYTSNFFAPAYLTLSPGFNWHRKDQFSIFLSPLSSRFTFVLRDQDELGPIYNLDPGSSMRYELGGYLTANFNKEILKNLTYKARLDLYSNYLENPENIDVFWTNMLTLKVNKFLAVTYNFDLIYDDDIKTFGPNLDAPGTQIKSLLGVGLTTTFK